MRWLLIANRPLRPHRQRCAVYELLTFGGLSLGVHGIAAALNIDIYWLKVLQRRVTLLISSALCNRRLSIARAVCCNLERSSFGGLLKL